MNGKTLMAIAVAGVFMGATSVWAGGAQKHGGLPGHSVQTPVTVSDAMPDRAHSDPASIGSSSAAFGASSGESASGSASFDSSASTDYWRMGEESSTGASSSAGASGSIGAEVSVSSDSSESSE